MTDATDTAKPVILNRRCAAFGRRVEQNRLLVEGDTVRAYDDVAHSYTLHHTLGASAIRKARADAQRLIRGEHAESHECHFA